MPQTPHDATDAVAILEALAHFLESARSDATTPFAREHIGYIREAAHDVALTLHMTDALEQAAQRIDRDEWMAIFRAILEGNTPR
ncbi:hypothetical protein [Oerskovia sp. Root22]|uniref:hypothetical protein n=1 Tax=Oerskovia sp. Root22 TaxID=1736494 RepID=UPI0006F75231|nr:hypothetical protein [Oerskovia sp. Root22]KRC42970.1 hypothetical protein ASE15_03135 [Oerskovia sp. Root22]